MHLSVRYLLARDSECIFCDVDNAIIHFCIFYSGLLSHSGFSAPILSGVLIQPLSWSNVDRVELVWVSTRL